MKYKHKIVFCIVLLLSLVNLNLAWGQAKPKIAIFPFQINGPQNLSYLKQSLPKLISERLNQAGVAVIPLEKVQKILLARDVEYLNMKKVRELTTILNGDYGLYGSFTLLEDTLSIDARLVSSNPLQGSASFFVVKKNLLNLLPAIEELVGKIKNFLLKREQIAEIEIKGNKVLDKDVILLRLRIQKGDTFDLDKIDKELKHLYDLGYFEDIKVFVQDEPTGKKLTFEVKEKPLIQAISIQGNHAIGSKKILEVISSQKGSIFNPAIVAEDIDKIRELYRKKGYYKVKVTYAIDAPDQKRGRLIFKIKEGPKLYIKKIIIKGAKQISPDEIKDQLALKERGFFSWFTGSGILREDYLERDVATIEAYYANKGFMDVEVGQPKVDFKDDGIYITFTVIEGKRYRVGKVEFKGKLIVPRQKLLDLIEMDDLAKEHAYFNRSIIHHDVQAITNLYMNYGYAFADCEVKFKKDATKGVISVLYIPQKGDKYYIRRVLIQGNTQTRDNVIRRELRLADGDLFNGQKIRRSNARLNKLGFFESAEVKPEKTNEPNFMDLIVKVKEKPTGMLSAGAGYSSLDKFFVTAQIKQRNLFGKGYDVSLQGSFSGRKSTYTFSFWDPQFNDSDLGIGFSVFNLDEQFFDYDKHTIGGQLNFSYPLGEYTNLYWHYRAERYTIKNVSDDADQDIKDLEGNHWSSSFYVGATRDTTNRLFNPTRGTKNTLSLEYSGGLLGGDDNYIKTLYDFTWYKPLIKSENLIFHWHFKLGYLTKNGDEEIPSFVRFYLGGINSIRGYPGREIAPKYANGDFKGGNKEFFTNLELLFPINKELGVVGVLFFDAGNTWDETQFVNTKLYKSIGVGVRWYSPLGPLRLEYGYGLDSLDGERTKKLEFSVGQFF